MKITTNNNTVNLLSKAKQSKAKQSNGITLNFLKNNLIINLINYFLILYPFLSDTLILTTYWERRNPILL